MKLGPVLKQNSVQLLHELTVTVVTQSEVFKMSVHFLILMPIVFGVIAGDYVGPQNGFRNRNGNGNGNGNSYGVPPDSITPPQPQGGPYPPSGWKPSGRRLLLPGESRSAQQPIDSGYGQPLPPTYGPVSPPPSGPSIDSQYGPSVDNTGPPDNQYIPGTGFSNGGNGFSNGNGHTGNGHNGNGNRNGNGHGNGNGNRNGNGNGQSGGNGFSTGNGHEIESSGNGHGSGNGFSNGGNGNGFSNGNGQNGGNGASKGNGNGNGNNGSNGANSSKGFVPAFQGAYPGGVVYPFVQHSVPAVLAFRPGNGAGHGTIYPIYQVPISPSQPGTGIITTPFSTGHGVFSLPGGNPSFQISPDTTDLGTLYPDSQITGTHDVAGSQPAVGQGTSFLGHGIGSYYALLSDHQSQKPNILGVKNGLSNLQLQYAIGNTAYGNEGVPLSVF